MKRYVGIDVAQDQCALCIVDDAGAVILERTCPTDPDEIVRAIAPAGGDVDKIVHEPGPLSVWLTRKLIEWGAPIFCIDARAAHKVLSARMNKSDKSDAVGLAQLARTDWYGEVHVNSEASDQLRLLLSARDRLIRIRMDNEGQARALLKAYGIRLGPVNAGYSRQSFGDQLAAAINGDQTLEVIFGSLIAVHDTVCLEATTIDAKVQRLAKKKTLWPGD